MGYSVLFIHMLKTRPRFIHASSYSTDKFRDGTIYLYCYWDINWYFPKDELCCAPTQCRLKRWDKQDQLSAT